MATVQMIEYDKANPRVRRVFDEIMAKRGIDIVPNVWKTLAAHPPTLERVWRELQVVMAPGRLDSLTKEMIAIAVSATNGCEYCVWSHTAAARKLGLDDEMLGEMMAVVGMFNQTNKLAMGYQLEVDEMYREAARTPPKAKPRAKRRTTAKTRAVAKSVKKSTARPRRTAKTAKR